MAVNAKIEFKKENWRPFPKLMVFEMNKYKTIVYFKEESDKGIQVFSSCPENKDLQMRETGGWVIDEFKDFDGEVILSND